MTTGQIADEDRLHRTRMLYYVRRSGIPIRPVPFIRQYDMKKKELAKLRQQGRRRTEITQQYGCSVTTVERALRRRGLVGG